MRRLRPREEQQYQADLERTLGDRRGDADMRRLVRMSAAEARRPLVEYGNGADAHIRDLEREVERLREVMRELATMPRCILLTTTEGAEIVRRCQVAADALEDEG